MRKSGKMELVAELKEMIVQADGLVAVNYSRLNAGQMDAARRAVRESGANMRVVKNTLFSIAVRDTRFADMAAAVNGAVAIVALPGEAPPVLRALSTINEQIGRVEVQCGHLGGRVRTAAEMIELAYLPSREQLAAMVAGAVRMPLTNLVRMLQMPLVQLARVVQRAADKAGASASAA